MATHLRVKDLMQERDMGVKELAYKANIAISTVSSLRKNDVARVDIAVLDRVAEVFGVTVGDLFVTEGTEGKAPAPPRTARKAA